MTEYIVLTEDECYDLYLDRAVTYKSENGTKYVLCSEEFFKNYNMIRENEEEVQNEND